MYLDYLFFATLVHGNIQEQQRNFGQNSGMNKRGVNNWKTPYYNTTSVGQVQNLNTNLFNANCVIRERVKDIWSELRIISDMCVYVWLP